MEKKRKCTCLRRVISRPDFLEGYVRFISEEEGSGFFLIHVLFCSDSGISSLCYSAPRIFDGASAQGQLLKLASLGLVKEEDSNRMTQDILASSLINPFAKFMEF